MSHSYMPISFSSQYPPVVKSRLLELTVLLLTLHLTLAGCASSPALQTENKQQVNFTGFWELDGQMSDRVNEKMRWLYAAARSDAERRARANNDRRRPMPVSSRDILMGDVEAIIGLGRLAEMITKATVLTITQTDSRIIIERDDDFALVCEFGVMRESESGLGQELCGWFGDQLAFEISLPEGLRVSHLLTLATAGDRLNLATTVRSSRTSQSFSLNRVYIPFEPVEDRLYDCEYTLVNQTTCKLGKSGK